MRIALEHAHVSMGEMADLLEVSGNTIGNYLAGRSIPSAAVLRVWAMRCGVPLEWIKYGNNPDGDDPDRGTVTLGYHTLTRGFARDRHLIAA